MVQHGGGGGRGERKGAWERKCECVTAGKEGKKAGECSNMRSVIPEATRGGGRGLLVKILAAEALNSHITHNQFSHTAGFVE